jgi:hypothetical protein
MLTNRVDFVMVLTSPGKHRVKSVAAFVERLATSRPKQDKTNNTFAYCLSTYK